MIAQTELTGNWEKRLEDIRTGFGSNIPGRNKRLHPNITQELLQSGKGFKVGVPV